MIAATPGSGRSLNGWLLPPGRWVPITDRGSVFVRELAGPVGAPVVVLLHGLGATSGLQFAPTMNQLAAEFRVLAVDMRRCPVPSEDGGRGFFDSVAEDVAAALDSFGVARAVVLGYSVGGLVARVLAARRPDLVSGIVFAATFGQVPRGPWTAPVAALGSAFGSALGALHRLPRVPSRPRAGGDARSATADDELGVVRWIAAEAGKLEPGLVLAALQAAVEGSVPPVAELGDRPLAFIVTTRDRMIAPRWQRAFAATAPDAPVFEVAAGHAASGLAPGRFGPVALAACQSVVGRVVES